EERLARGDDVALLDVREPVEHQIARLPGAMLVPLAQLPARVGEVERAKDLVVYCHHGMRSARAIQYLVQSGFDPARLFNLAGGIDAWSREVDSSVPIY